MIKRFKSSTLTVQRQRTPVDVHVFDVLTDDELKSIYSLSRSDADVEFFLDKIRYGNFAIQDQSGFLKDLEEVADQIGINSERLEEIEEELVDLT